MHIYVQIYSFHEYLCGHSVCGTMCLLLACSRTSERGVTHTHAHLRPGQETLRTHAHQFSPTSGNNCHIRSESTLQLM